MTFEPWNKYVLVNHNILPVSDSGIADNERGIYEVLRVIDGVPLFFEDHFARFCKSAELAEISLGFDKAELFGLLRNLIEKNETAAGNIIISKGENLVAHFIRHSYPTEEMYKSGVECRLLDAERNNPNIKILHTRVRERSNELMAETDCFEVVLVDHSGNVTEGSRSNLFFVKEEKIYTPPGNQVLLGITRQKAIESAAKIHIPVIETPIKSLEIGRFDAAFITGTSPKILPVRQLDAVNFDAGNKTVGSLINEYNKMILEYIGLHK